MPLIAAGFVAARVRKQAAGFVAAIIRKPALQQVALHCQHRNRER